MGVAQSSEKWRALSQCEPNISAHWARSRNRSRLIKLGSMIWFPLKESRPATRKPKKVLSQVRETSFEKESEDRVLRTLSHSLEVLQGESRPKRGFWRTRF